MVSEAQKKAVKNYYLKTYDRIDVGVSKKEGDLSREKIKAYAIDRGVSMNALFKEALVEMIKRDEDFCRQRGI